ncbi:MAG: twin-arginine translocase TatA/TatE family subunit [Actinomycetota bacterium]|nr:twin-arginine translocase TatA/TatE family subunit [Actinomycetota bacterium]
MPNIGPLEIAIVLVIVLLIFGPKRLPDLGRSMGRGLREFKDSVTGKDDEKAIEPGDETVKTASADEEPARSAKPADVS